MNNGRKVDLLTNSPTVEDKMLGEYPHKIHKGQYSRFNGENRKLRLFLRLEEKELIPYLVYIEAELSSLDCYEVRVSGGENILESKKL